MAANTFFQVTQVPVETVVAEMWKKHSMFILAFPVDTGDNLLRLQFGFIKKLERIDYWLKYDYAFCLTGDRGEEKILQQLYRQDNIFYQIDCIDCKSGDEL